MRGGRLALRIEGCCIRPGKWTRLPVVGRCELFIIRGFSSSLFSSFSFFFARYFGFYRNSMYAKGSLVKVYVGLQFWLRRDGNDAFFVNSDHFHV